MPVPAELAALITLNLISDYAWRNTLQQTGSNILFLATGKQKEDKWESQLEAIYWYESVSNNQFHQDETGGRITFE